ncbi:DNA cytosine methyltransferase [Achromobacter xylosoxidans]|uniref:DNA cytosine methyltransferase n=1 Tax=Alcaligenes xylosoxydans xylosoxydans TaxID=85698 RepID=UPI0022B882DD|nr:DNA cytosine methyltransferase [Achromobacter xylosoxidans]MCZ8391589.1 DNA cytosine methyltransferase [Achromobacter xylosoxidans]
MSEKKIPVISLFSGAMGLDLGLEAAGFEVVVAVECDAQAVATIRKNKPDLPVFDKRIESVTSTEILKAAGLKKGGNFVVCGGPSCQSFSTAGHRRSLADPRGNLFLHFVRIVRETEPKFFVMENVRGMLSAAVKHRPLSQRGPGHLPLEPEEELGSAFRVIVNELKELDYFITFDLLNSADYGVPQVRHRLIFLGSREGKAVSLPAPTHHKSGEMGLPQWTTVRQTIGRFREENPEGYSLRETEAKYLAHVPEGGNWKNLPIDMQREALGGAYVSWGGRSGFYRRLAWDKPSPALPTQPYFRATMLCHPDALRPLSIKEYARIQQFPDTWKFEGSIASRYRQIGNAVPVGLGTAIGNAIKFAWKKHAGKRPLGVVETSNSELIRKMMNRPVTILNPPRMRKDADNAETELWRDVIRKRRDTAHDYASTTDTKKRNKEAVS